MVRVLISSIYPPLLEFIDVGKPARALDTLQEVFSRNKKWTYTWSESIVEPIMFKFLDLCVELKKSHIAKEGLFQYRNMVQLVNVGSLENVIRTYLRKAEARTEAAQAQSNQAVLDCEDLDNLCPPETILMSAVSGEDAQDRSDRTILLPWVKFLWESYCQCLELLRLNTHCETLYHDIARMAFQFCLKYTRKVEFRKLCEKLRKHLEDISKAPAQSNNIVITRPETQQLNLDTRLFQLESAIQMELWQEAYKAIEDIHSLMALAKKTPVSKTLANYYQKLAMVFAKAGNQLFHAAALFKLFQLTRDMKKTTTTDEVQRMASHVVLAVISIPLPSAHPEFDRFIETDKSPQEKAQRLAVLLSLQQAPTRASLLRDIVRLKVLDYASPQMQALYNHLEVEFDPLHLCQHVQKAIDEFKSDENSLLQQYVPALQEITVCRLIRQVAQVYQSMEFARLLELAHFADIFYLERILIDCVRHNDMQIRIDHRKSCVHFGTDLAESQREHRMDGPLLQSMPSEQIRSQLVSMSVVLHRAIAAINPNRRKAERETLRTQMVKQYHATKKAEHQRILSRQKIIEERKEYIERLNIEYQEEEQRRQEEQTRAAKKAEQKRLEAEKEERDRKRSANEAQAQKERSAKEKTTQVSQVEQTAQKEADDILKERKEQQQKLKSLEKRVDYYERAKRITEIPLIEKMLPEKQVLDKEFWEKHETTRIEQAMAERKNAVAQQERLKRMLPDRDVFADKLKAERNTVYQEKVKAFDKHLAEEKKKRLADRVVQRRHDRREKWLREKEEEKRRREDEIRKAREEEERQEADRRKAVYEAEMEKLRVQAEKQRAKEEEVERKLREEREALSKSAPKEDDGRRGGDDRGPSRAPPAQGERDWRSKDAPAAASTGESSSAWRRSEAPRGEMRRGDDRRGDDRRGDDYRGSARAGEDRPRGEIRRGEDRRGDDRRGDDFRGPPRGGDRDRDGPRGGDRDRDAPRGGDRDRKPWGKDDSRDGGVRSTQWRRDGPSANDAAPASGGSGGGAKDWRSEPRQERSIGTPRTGGDRDAPRGVERGIPRDTPRDAPRGDREIPRDGPRRDAPRRDRPQQQDDEWTAVRRGTRKTET